MADVLLLFGELALITVCGYYADDLAQRLWQPRPRVPCQEWREMVEPVVKKARLAVTLDMNTTFNPDGSQALADLIERMATELDARS